MIVLKYLKFTLLLVIPLMGISQVSVPEMVFVKGGDFLMGCSPGDSTCMSDEKPSVHVELYDYWIGKYEVTNAQYAEFLSHVGNQTEGQSTWYLLDKYSLIEDLGNGVFKPKEGFANLPVTNVSWYGAVAYTKWLSDQTGDVYRLPTEAEWEYAARGGQKSKGYLFSGSNNPEEVGWISDYAANSKTGWSFKKEKGVHAGGQKLANELGLHDMSGNVSEWCSDVYENTYQGGINPSGIDVGSLRVLRGGSWDNKPQSCRVSTRNYAQHVNRFSVNKGFRIVMEKDISTPINAFAEENNFNGTVLIKKREKTIYHESFGRANHEKELPNTNETQYAIASITKLFTATLILQLVEESELDLNTPIIKYLPDYMGSGANSITIHHLLTHTSGIQNCEDFRTKTDGLPDVYIDDVNTDELLKKYCSGLQKSEPGTVFNYNNAEYIILGKIIEKITGLPFEDVLENQILKPLAMQKSGLITSASSMKTLAQGYKWNRESKSFIKDPSRLFQNYYASGAMYSTADDLAKFSTALYGGKLVNENSLKMLLTTYPETKGYGYGLWVKYPQYNKTVAKVSQRFGRIWGINTLISHFNDHDATVIVLSNTDKVSVSEFQHLVGELLFN